MQNLYSYFDSWQDKIHARTLKKATKKATFLKLLIIILILPFDIILFIFQKIFRIKVSDFIATDKWSDFNDFLGKNLKIGLISTPDKFIKNIKSGIIYIPASPIYFISCIGLWLPSNCHLVWTNFVIKFNTSYLKSYLLSDHKKSYLIIHSDALPFARSLVFACNRLKINTVCIQHGVFHEQNIIFEVDGSKSDINIIRSEEDKNIIKNISPNSQYLVTPDFFLLTPNKNFIKKNTIPRILFLGEGYHILDERLDNAYLKRLEYIYKKMLFFNCECFFRPHPSEKFKRISKGFKNIDNLSLNDSISITDCVIGYSSTLLYEAKSIGIPSFQVDVNNKFFDIQKSSSAKIERYNNAENVFNAARTYFKDKDLQKKNEYYSKREIEFSKILSLLIN